MNEVAGCIEAQGKVVKRMQAVAFGQSGEGGRRCRAAAPQLRQRHDPGHHARGAEEQ